MYYMSWFKKFYSWLLTAALLVVGLGGTLLWNAVIHTANRAAETPIERAVANLPSRHGLVHEGIMTTVFWVGETADSDNAQISNVPSAWDENWQASYGGVDNPDHRSGLLPTGFTPHENPFYFALPYADLTEDGARKASSNSCLPYTASTNDHYSWCKNVWIAVSYGGKTAYAQWEDVGPLLDDDTNYVFGAAAPRNTFGARAGLDVSPAVRDYLGLHGDDRTTWAFIPATDIPGGPWKDIVTTSPGYHL